MNLSSERIRKVINLLKIGVVPGLGFGMSICCVHLVIGGVLLMAMGMAPLTLFSAKTLLIELPASALIGALVSPVFLHRRGGIIHPIVLALIWISMERLVAVDPEKAAMWLMPSVSALGVYFGFRKLHQKKPKIVWAVAVAAPLLILALPVIRFHAMGGYDVPPVKKLRKAPEGAPDVVFVVMDTVRAKNVSAYGYERNTTPVFDAFAKEGTLFENAMSPGTWSLAAHASLFTGTLPSVHGAQGESNYLDDKLPTLAQAMTESGFDTRCFTANSFISSGFGLTRGFEKTDKAWQNGEGAWGFSFVYRLLDALGFMPADKGGSRVVDNVKDWMENRPKDAPPAFVFVNFLEAHFPSHQLPPQFRNAYTDAPTSTLRKYGQLAFGAQTGRRLTAEELARIQQPMRDLYDGGIRYTDYLLGRIIDIWRHRGTLDDTIFVVLGDHGEHVGEHKMYGHLLSMYQEDLAVPFMFRYPQHVVAGKRVSQPVSTLGVFATLFDLLDMTPPESVQWGSLASAMRTKNPKMHRLTGQPVMAERYEKKLIASRFKRGAINGKGPLLIPWGRYRAYRVGNYKYVKHYEDGKFSKHLFDLGEDPEELIDLAGNAAYASTLSELEHSLETWEKTLKLTHLDGQGTDTMNTQKGSNAPRTNAQASLSSASLHQ